MGAVGGVDQLGETDEEFRGADAAPDARPAKQRHTGQQSHGADAGPPAGTAQRAGGGPDGASSKGEQLVQLAKQQLGKPYVYGADGPGSFDCSGLLQYIAKQAGIDLPRVSGDQAKAGREVPTSDLRPGDILYFQDKGASGVTHVALYVGDGRYIHAPKPGENVKYGSMSDSYTKSTLKGARRVT
jgi:cell wall-associated NlpC family hydrolase